MVDKKDLQFNQGQSQPSSSSSQKSDVRMHVMPENIFAEDELYKKVNKSKGKQGPKKPEPKKVPKKEPKKTPPPSALQRPKSKKSKKGLMIAIIAVVVLLLAGGGFAGWYYYDQAQQEDLSKELEDIQDKNELDEKLAAEEAAKKAEQEKQEAEAKKARLTRDNQRILDIMEIQKALADYYEAEEKYPVDLSETALTVDETEYIDEIPTDPLNEEDYRYLYNSNDASKSYSLTFMLEEGVNNLGAGLHNVSNTEKLTANGTIQQIVVVKPDEKEKTIILSSTRDTDLDGLTDIEEELYGTDSQLFDSDEDTYTDHQEILNLYSPADEAPQTLLEVGLVKEFISEEQNYSLYYPHLWNMQAIDINDSEIMFVSDETSEYVSLTVNDNPGELELAQWIRVEMREVEVDYEAEYYQEEFFTQNKELSGVWLPELFRIYFQYDNKIYELMYNFDGLKQLAYESTFEMMAKSFKIHQTLLVEEEGDEDEVLDYEEENAETEEEISESEFIENEIEADLAEEPVEENPEETTSEEETPVEEEVTTEETTTEEETPVEEEVTTEETTSEEEAPVEEEVTAETPIEQGNEIDSTLDEFYGEEEPVVEEEFTY